MSGSRCNIGFTFILASLVSVQAFSQQISYRDSLSVTDYERAMFKPRLNYSLGSTFLFVPHLGTVTGFTFSPSLSIPLSPRLSLEGGIIAGRYYSTLWNSGSDVFMKGGFNALAVYGSASYRVNPQLTVYGSAIRQLTGTSPFNYLPKSSYSIGSTYNFGTFSIGVTLQRSEWDDYLNPLPFSGTQVFRPPY